MTTHLSTELAHVQAKTYNRLTARQMEHCQQPDIKGNTNVCFL